MLSGSPVAIAAQVTIVQMPLCQAASLTREYSDASPTEMPRQATISESTDLDKNKPIFRK